MIGCHFFLWLQIKYTNMKRKIITGIMLLLFALLLFSCSVTGKPGVIYEGKKGRWVFGGALHKQQRYDAKIRKDSITLVKQ